MITKSVSSTQAQNNFGQVLDDVTHNNTRYVIERRGVPQAILLSLNDFAQVLTSESRRQQINTILKEIRPEYHLGQILKATDESD
jgi:prevent-host-death family protein